MSGTQTAQNPIRGLLADAYLGWTWLVVQVVALTPFLRHRARRRRDAEARRLFDAGLLDEKVVPRKGTMGDEEWGEVIAARGGTAAAYFAGHGCRQLARDFRRAHMLARASVSSRYVAPAAVPAARSPHVAEGACTPSGHAEAA